MADELGKEIAALSDLLDVAKREVEAQGHVIAARESEIAALKETHVDFYQDRDVLEKSEHTIRDEFKSGVDIWAAWFAGTFVSKQDLLSHPNGLRRLILADPGGEQIARLAISFGVKLSDLQSDIRNLTDQAEANGIGVRWYDGPLVPMVIGAPAGDAWVRLEIPIYFSAHRPNLVVRDPGVVDRMKQTYETMWGRGEIPAAATARRAEDAANEQHDRTLREAQAVKHREEDEVSKSKADWADSLVDSARGIPPFVIKPRSAWLTKLEHLGEDEPWFMLCIPFEYCGPHRLLIGERIEGFLARWNGNKFNLPPIPTIDPDTKPPFDRFGPTGGILRLEQRVSPASAASLKKALGYDDPEKFGKELLFNIVTAHLFVSVRVLSFAGEVLWEGKLFGEELMDVQYKIVTP